MFVTALVTLYHISPSRSKQVAEAILPEFDGIVGSDSYSAWNDAGSDHQKCLLHYFRDLYRTLDRNRTDEFKALFDEMHGILKDAISLAAERPEGPAPKERIRKLRDRIDAVAHGAHTDKDCKRYAKRLRREGRYLLTFLEYDVDYHNNPSEWALRIFACMRKTPYGNRSEAGMETTETLATVYAACELRGINPYHFFRDYLDGRVNGIPMPQTPAIAA